MSLFARLFACLIAILVLTGVGEAEEEAHIIPPQKDIKFDLGKQIGEISFVCKTNPKKTCTLTQFMNFARVCALMVVKDGKQSLLRFKKKGRCKDRPGDNDEKKEFGIASVTKSITSTLLGAAIAEHDGAKSKRDFEIAVTRTVDEVITELGGADPRKNYRGVTLERVLNMRSGLQWDDDADGKKFGQQVRNTMADSIVSFAMPYEKKNETDYTKLFNYSALDASINGVIAERLSGKKLTDYLTQPIWAALGMEAKARWGIDNMKTGIGACCFYLTIRDLARFGQFVLAKGKTSKGNEIIPSGWFDLATVHGPGKTDEIPDGNISYIDGCPLDYRYQWWLRRRPAMDFTAIGIAGQFVHIYPEEHAVVVQISDWGYWHNGDARTCMTMLAHDALVKAAGQ